MNDPRSRRLPLLDLHPPTDRLLDEVLAGLRSRPRTLPCKYFYDEEGSRLFERITELPEYYPTRTELGILRRHVGEMAAALGSGCLLIEPGSGSSVKTRLLLDALFDPAGYVPVDISREHLLRAAEKVALEHPGLVVLPVCADFTRHLELPPAPISPRRRVVYFPGSTLGNYDPEGATRLLRQLAERVGPGGGLLLGLDQVKDPTILERAYDDAQGVTAAFNLNLLRRLDRELGADFDPGLWAHRAIWNAEECRIEMHLVSRRAQSVHLAGERFDFEATESIQTESSYKYDEEVSRELAARSGWRVERRWTDAQDWFAVEFWTATSD